MSLNISKTGILKGQNIETFLTLSDGSKWRLLLCHWVDNGRNLFTQLNAGYCNEEGLYSRLNWIDNFIYNGRYEFYVIQDGTVYRWTQTNAPLSTTAVAGYTAVVGNPGGICYNGINTLLAASNASNNWWRACGCWTSFTSGGIHCIPAFGVDTARRCQNHLILYARVNDFTAYSENNIIATNNFYEY